MGKDRGKRFGMSFEDYMKSVDSQYVSTPGEYKGEIDLDQLTGKDWEVLLRQERARLELFSLLEKQTDAGIRLRLATTGRFGEPINSYGQYINPTGQWGATLTELMITANQYPTAIPIVQKNFVDNMKSLQDAILTNIKFKSKESYKWGDPIDVDNIPDFLLEPEEVRVAKQRANECNAMIENAVLKEARLAKERPEEYNAIIEKAARKRKEQEAISQEDIQLANNVDRCPECGLPEVLNLDWEKRDISTKLKVINLLNNLDEDE